jgi:predicted nucleic acid-binding Zn ribbon protein
VPDEPRPGERGAYGPELARLAADALADAKADARARGERAPAGDSAAERRLRGGPGDPARRQSGAGGAGRTRRDDPQPLQAAIDGLLDDRGWRTAASVASVFGRWEQIVGAALAAHTRPGGFTDGELLVIADSTAWATQVRLLRAQLVGRLNAELGDGTVTGVKVRGPAPPRQRGQWRVRDTRGPRDDYG